MGKQINVTAVQESLTTTKGTARSHSVTIDRPESKDGTDLGMMGGEMLLVSLGGCFMSNLLEIVRTREADISNIRVDIAGELSEDKPTRYVGVNMVVHADTDDRDILEKYILMSERGCIVAQSLKQGFPVNVRVAN